MTCDERRDHMLLYVADALARHEREAVDAHLGSGCPRCAGHLAEAGSVLGHLPLALPPVEPPPRLRERLIERVAADRKRGTVALFPARGSWLVGWGRPAVTATLAAGLLYALVVLPLRERQRALDAELTAQQRTIDELRGDLLAARSAVDMLASRELKLALLASGGPQPEAWGRLLRDERNRIWQLYAFDLQPLGPDKTYELWFITDDDRKIPAGTFDVDAAGRGRHHVTVPHDLEGIVVAAVTDEPAGGSPQPTGQIQLVAQL